MQVLYFDGVELSDPDQTLADAGVVPAVTIQLFIDKSVEADLQGAFDAQERQTSGGGSKRATEDGFVGSALLSSSAPKAAPAPGAIDCGDM